MLVGRSSESAQIDRLLNAVRGGAGRALAVLGEPGIGKTALLQYAERQAADMKRLSIVGVAPEAALPTQDWMSYSDRFCGVWRRCQRASRGRSSWRLGLGEMMRPTRWLCMQACWRCWRRWHRARR